MKRGDLRKQEKVRCADRSHQRYRRRNQMVEPPSVQAEINAWNRGLIKFREMSRQAQKAAM